MAGIDKGGDAWYTPSRVRCFMAKDAMGKLREADTLDKEATKIKQKDPVSAVALQELARGKRRAAIKQLKRRPKRRGNSKKVVL